VATFAMSLSPNLPLMLVFACVFGFGYAGVTLSVNVLASELTPHRRAATLNLVNVFYAVGAIIGPLLAGRAIAWWGTARPALWTGAALMTLVSPAALAILPALHKRHEVAIGSADADADADVDVDTAADAAADADVDASSIADAGGSAGGALSRGLRTALTSSALPAAFLWTAGVLVLLYVGSEASVGGWTPTYLARSAGVDPSRAATITSMFWMSLCVGRLFGTVGGLHLAAERLLLVSILAAVGGAALLLIGHGWLWPTVIALSVLGLSYGPIYPTMAAIVIAGAPHMAGTAMSRIGVFASVGGMALPWLQGALLTNVGTSAAAIQTLAMAIGMAAMWAMLHKIEPA